MLYRLCHNMGGSMPKSFFALLLLKSQQIQRAIPIDFLPDVHNLFVPLSCQRRPGQTRTDILCNIPYGYAFLIFPNRTVFQFDLNHLCTSFPQKLLAHKGFHKPKKVCIYIKKALIPV